MSPKRIKELRNLALCYEPNKVDGDLLECIKEIEHLQAELEEKSIRIRREQMEADCKVVCKECRINKAIWSEKKKAWGHLHYEFVKCKAHAIRTAFEGSNK